jgi:crotonobetainyl-CoA:carnitine CoA-transferase CaiB-like acyl-CoA transferase
VGVANEGLWRKFAPVAGIDPDDPRFATAPDRSRNRADLASLIEKAFAQGTREQWLARFREIGVPAGAIRSLDEVYEWDQTRSQGLVIEVDHPTLGRIELPGPAIRFDDAEPNRHTAPPRLGEHTDDILAWLDQVDS